MPPPPPPRGKGQTPAPKPSPKPSKVAKVAAQPPPEALDVEALGASVAPHVTDVCQVLVEQAAATGVEAAVAKGRSADHKSALAKAEKVQGNTQRALDQALNLAAKSGEEVEAMRGALREAEDGRRKAEVEAAQLRMEVEAQRRRGGDLQQRLGWLRRKSAPSPPPSQPPSPPSRGWRRQGCRVRVAGVGVGVNDSWVC